MTNIKQFEEKAKSVISILKENFDSIGAGEEEYYGDENTSGHVAPLNADPESENVITVSTEQETGVVPIEKAPTFRVYWRAWKEGNSTSGQTESTLETANMARAEAMTKLYDLGFNDIEILAIETIKQNESITV